VNEGIKKSSFETEKPVSVAPLSPAQKTAVSPDRGEQCIHQVFQERARQAPSSPAVTGSGLTLSYGDLNERSNRLARFLRKLGVKRESLVGLCLERQPDLIVGILGILKAGGAYVPVDLAYPRDRVSFMLADAQVSVLITQSSLQEAMTGHAGRTVYLDQDWPSIAGELPEDFETEVTPDDLAYVIYTSGSTGKPKGSLITHRNVVRLFQSTEAWFHFDASDVWTLFHSSAFDFSVWEIWGALFYGGRVAVIPFETTRTPEAFYRLLCDEHVTVLNQTPSAFRQLIRAEESVGRRDDLALRYVIFGGEALDMKTLQPWFERHGDRTPRLINMYGITETTVHVTYRPLSVADVTRGSVIGEPIPDLRLFVLNDKLQPVLPGQTGEICVGGAGLGRGYLNRPDLTAEKFVSLAFGSVPAQRLYRSGDLGRFLANGDLEYLGRMDHQVKIRGFRIELGEIEAVLNSHPGIRESVVLPRDDARGEKRLVAYLIARDRIAIPAAELRQLLRGRVPEYMVPAIFAFIDQLPLTTNGKLDAAALPNPTADETVDIPAQALPQSQLEREIAAIWQETLGRTSVGRDENFFDGGGTSLTLAEVHERVQKHLARNFPITEMFANPTVASLAQYLGTPVVPKQTSDAIQLRARRQREAQAARVRKPL
jgi:amino acid adenylation domain-containing protein